MFKNKKTLGTILVSGLLSSSCGLVASANKNIKDIKDIPTIGRSMEADIIPANLYKLVLEIRSTLTHDGNLINAAPLMEEAENLVREHNLDVFLPWQDLTPYEALFDLSYCEDLDKPYSYLCEKKDVPAEVEEIINCETYYTNTIDSLRKNLKKGGTEEKLDYTKRSLVVHFKERELVRKKLAFCVAKYGIELKKKFIGVEKENIKNTSNIENKKKQSLVRPDAVSKNSWGFLDIVFGIKDKVKMLLGLKEENKEFVSKEDDLKREAKRQETEFGLSLLVKRFLDFVRSSDSTEKAQHKNENTQKNSNNSVNNLLVSGQNNFLTDGNTDNNR